MSVVAGCLARGPAAGSGTATARSTVTVRLLGPNVDRVLFERTAVRSVGEVRTRDGRASLEVALSDAGAARVRDRFRTANVDDEPGAFEIAVVDGQREIARFGVAPGLANETASDDWEGTVRLTFEQRSDAEAVRAALACAAETPPPSCNAG